MDSMDSMDRDDEDSQESTVSKSSSSTDSDNLTSMQTQTSSSNWTGSLIEYYGPSSSFCGYCKRGDPYTAKDRRSYDFQAFRLTANDYQDLLDRCWRRSGRACYCPINQQTCCPNFSISCKAIKFQLSKSQRECIKRLNNFLYGSSVKVRAPIEYDNSSNDLFKTKDTNISAATKTLEQISASSKARDRRFFKACERLASRRHISINEAMKQVQSKWQKYRPKILSLEDFLYPRKLETTSVSEPKHKLTLNMVHIDSKYSQELRKQEHLVMTRYQKAVHKDHYIEWTMPRYCDFLVDSPIVVESLKNYDYVQNDDEKEGNVDSFSNDVYSNSENLPFILHKPPQLPTAYGSYHCSYHLDGQLIAVGVLDVLPKCITTVYFFYDPNYAFLNLGVYSALVEISMVRQMWSRFSPAKSATSENPVINSENILEHYYLGFYVHECKKMHYKVQFKPSYLLCCKTYKYVETEKCLAKLKGTKYTEFSTPATESSENQSEFSKIEFQSLLEVTINWPKSIKPSSCSKLLDYLLWLEANLGTEYVELFVNGYLATFANLVGPDILSRLCLKTSLVHITLVKRHERLQELDNRRQQRASSSTSNEQSNPKQSS